jgi:nucleoside-diphosphate-sugar epimerase
LLPLLTTAGHEVIGMSRSGKPVASERVLAVDALDHEAVTRAVADVSPNAIVNMLTAIPSEVHPRRIAAEFEMTNRLRTEGTRNLLDAADRAGVEQTISQSVAFAYEPRPGLADEDEPLWQNPPRQYRPVLRAVQELEQATLQANGLVLRIGHLYGPGTIYARNGSFTQAVRAGKVLLVGRGMSVFSFSHVDDVATAILAALDKNLAGLLNIVDDAPAPMREWLPAFAELSGAPEPKSIPTAVARVIAGGWGVAFMTRLRGSDNTRARVSLDWRPTYMSWRDGLGHEFAPARPIEATQANK